MHSSQKTGNFIKSAKVAVNAANPSFAALQPGSLVYAQGAALKSVFIDQGGDVVPLVPIQVGQVSTTPLPLIGNGAVGVFEQPNLAVQTGVIKFITRNVTAAGSAVARGVVGFSLIGDAAVITVNDGQACFVQNAVGDRTTGHFVTTTAAGLFQAEVQFTTPGNKTLILQYGNESYFLTLAIV